MIQWSYEKICVFFTLFSFLVFTVEANAQGVQLSTTQSGAIAMYTSQIPPNPCVTFGIGEGKTRTVVGFNYSAFSVDGNGAMNGNLTYIDITQSKVEQVIIAGQTIHDFTLSYATHEQVSYKLTSPLTFTIADTASLNVSNVNLVSNGKIKLVFALEEPDGTHCLNSGYTTLFIGADTNSVNSSAKLPITQKTIITKTPSTVSTVFISSSISPMPTSNNSISIKKSLKENMIHTSPLQNFSSFIKSLFHWF